MNFLFISINISQRKKKMDHTPLGVTMVGPLKTILKNIRKLKPLKIEVSEALSAEPSPPCF